MKTSALLVKAVDTKPTDSDIDSEAPTIDDGLTELASQDTSIFGLLKTLLSTKTLPHIAALAVVSSFLYAVADGQAGLAAVGFASLAAGYTTTALLSNNERIRSWTQLQQWDENRPNIARRFLLSSRILAVPYLSAAGFAAGFLLLTSEGATDWLALGMAGLFVLWAVAQGRSFAAWGASMAAKKPRPSMPARGNGYGGLAVLLGAVLALGTGGVTAYAYLRSPTHWSAVDIVDLIAFTGIALGAFVLMNTLTWKLRAIAIKDKSLRRFHFRWSLLIHLFVTWHLLTVFRHAVMGTGTLEVYIEEIALMIFTVFMGIWSLTSRGIGSELKLLNKENALPWGLAFGYAYAGSVAMISAAVGDLKVVMALGHIIAAITGIMMHRTVLRNLLERHDTDKEVKRIVEQVTPKGDLEPQTSEHSESDSSEAKVPTNEEDWNGELAPEWEEAKDIGIEAEVEWEDVINIDD